MKAKLIFLTGLMITGTLSWAGTGTHGTDEYTQSKALLKGALSGLIDKLKSNRASCSTWVAPHASLILQALQNLKEAPDDLGPKMDNGDYRLMYYQTEPNPAVLVYKTFYENYKALTDADVKDESPGRYVRTVQKFLLRETAHLWKKDDEDAERVAVVLLNELLPESSLSDSELRTIEEKYSTENWKKLAEAPCQYPDRLLVTVEGGSLGVSIFSLKYVDPKTGKYKDKAFGGEGTFERIIPICRDDYVIYAYTGTSGVRGAPFITLRTLDQNVPNPVVHHIQFSTNVDHDTTGDIALDKACPAMKN